MAKRILVIGGTGLLGEPVVRHLRKSGFAMRLMVRNVEQAARRFGDGFEIVKGDLADAWHLKVAARNCYGVHINLSGKIEQVGVERIAAVASNHRLQRITYISGTSVAAENVGVPGDPAQVFRRASHTRKRNTVLHLLPDMVHGGAAKICTERPRFRVRKTTESVSFTRRG